MDTMAFNENELGSMRGAITGYIEQVNACINKISGHTVNASDGVYGADQARIVDDYIQRTCDEVSKIVMYFDEFSQKLAEVQAAYDAKQAAITTGDVAAAPTNDGDLVNVNRMN